MTSSTRPTMTTKFLRFHAANPRIYDTLRRFTREGIELAPGKPLAIALVFERARWEEFIATDDEPFRLSNSYRAFYSRLLMNVEPDLRGVFALRPSEADERGNATQPDTLVLWQEEARRDDGWLEEATRIVQDHT